MIFCCSKCKKELTSDLYQLRKKEEPIDHVYAFDSSTNRYELESVSFKENVFRYSPKSKQIFTDPDDGYYKVFHEPATYSVSRYSVLSGIIPPFTEGSGCCNFSSGHELKCSCSNVIGKMFLDCYEDSRVDFIAKNVDRKYCKK